MASGEGLDRNTNHTRLLNSCTCKYPQLVLPNLSLSHTHTTHTSRSPAPLTQGATGNRITGTVKQCRVNCEGKTPKFVLKSCRDTACVTCNTVNKGTGHLNIALGIKDAGSCNPRKWVNQGQISPQTTYVSSVVAKGDDADALAKLYDDWCDQTLLHGGDATRPGAASVGVWLPLVATVLFLLRGVWVR